MPVHQHYLSQVHALESRPAPAAHDVARIPGVVVTLARRLAPEDPLGAAREVLAALGIAQACEVAVVVEA